MARNIRAPMPPEAGSNAVKTPTICDEIILLTSGHQALDHRVFDKEAVSLARAFPHVRVVGAHANDDVRAGVTITALPPYPSRLHRFLWRPLQCFLAVRSRGRHVLILHDAELLPWVPWIKLFTSWRVIYDVHEDFAQLLLQRAWIPRKLRRLIAQNVGVLEKLLSYACDGIMGATQVLVENFPHRRHVAIYNLPSREFIARSAACCRPLSERDYDVVHHGTLSEERLQFLCAVLDALFVRKPAARALVFGVRPDQERMLHTQYPADRVTVIGKVPYGQVAELLGNCRIGLNVHPVLHPHLRCAVPVKVFEYMASGCNVITSFLPELDRLLGEDGAGEVVVIQTPSFERFAAEAARLLDDPAALERHQAALMALVETRWNWEREAERLVDFVSEIAGLKESMPHEQVFDHQC